MPRHVTLDPRDDINSSSDLPFSLDRTRFKGFLTYLRSVQHGEDVDDASLRSAVTSIAFAAVGNVTKDIEDTVGTLDVVPTSGIGDFLRGTTTTPTPFEQQRIPRQLIVWREEVKNTQPKSQPASVGLEPITKEPLSSTASELETGSNLRPSKRKHKSASRESDTSDQSSRSGAGIPDVLVVFRRKASLRRLILAVIELRVFKADRGSRSDKIQQWRRGMAQGILYLAQCHDASATYLGAVVILTQFARLFAKSGAIYVEVAEGTPAIGTTMTIQDFLKRAPELSEALPHDLLAPTRELSEPAVRVLWEHLSRARSMVEMMDADNIPEHVPGAPGPMPGTVSFDDLASDLEGLLLLARTAHPDKFPSWWVKAKLALIRAGTPNERVPPNARSKGGTHSSRDGSDIDRKDGDDGCDGEAGLDVDSRHGEGRGDATDGTTRRTMGGSTGGQGGNSNTPRTHVNGAYPHGPHLTDPEPVAPPDSDTGEEELGATRHLERWLQVTREQQTPVHSPAKFYPVGEIRRETAITADHLTSHPADSDTNSDSDSVSERDLVRCAADFTLRGWRVVLVSPTTFDELTSEYP